MANGFEAETSEQRAQRIARQRLEREQRAQQRRQVPLQPVAMANQGQGQPPAVAGAAVNPQVAAFARTPETRNTGVLDFSAKEDLKLYHQAAKGLYQDTEELFGCEATDFLDFMYLVQARANEFGWSTGFLNIPFDPNNPNQGTTSLIHNYGEISYERILRHEQSYIATHTRNAQDTDMLYKCLMKSLSRQGRLKVQNERTRFVVHLPGTNPGGNEAYHSGALLLKIIIDKSSTDSNAVATVIREQMTTLKEYIVKVNYDIEVFHTHVKSLVEQLRSRGGEIKT